MEHLRELTDGGMFRFGDDGAAVQSTKLGSVMAKFCVELPTMRLFRMLEPGADLKAERSCAIRQVWS